MESVLVNFMAVNIGAAYLSQNKEGTKFYTYACPALAPFKTKANSAKDVEDFIERFKGLTHQEFLHACFENDSNPFGSSDIVPYKLVCTYLWITK